MNRLSFYFFLSWALWFGSLGCSSSGNKKNIRDYYFPLKKMKTGLVYEYQPVSGDLSPVYWYYRTIVNPDGVFFIGTYYEYDLVPLQFVREEMVGNGMLLEEIFLYNRDSTGKQQPVPVEILAGNVFPFELSGPEGIFLYKIRWSPPDDPEATTTLVKNRRYLGDTTIVFEGRPYEAVTFEVRELLEYDK